MGDNECVSASLNELLARCRAGDRSAFDLLTQRFYGYASSLADALLNGRRDAVEDAVQSAFVVVLVRVGDLRDAEAFPGWLRQIVRTECSRITRTMKTERFDGKGYASVETPLDEAVRQEHLQSVRHAIENLPRLQRETAELFYLDELAQREISRALDVPVGTVKRRLFDAREKLRETLSESGKTRLPI
ncbi:MAG TPA: sigma-70 family RNA polymerase sigma factor [Tepidisphaeraceae bacterium]|jgi:RNA polymerase sigma factor (sigma-70 family)|nr:sigma-70 family RNA polymerase sigma factor [Tepidisphaeraceae bacterium]